MNIDEFEAEISELQVHPEFHSLVDVANTEIIDELPSISKDYHKSDSEEEFYYEDEEEDDDHEAIEIREQSMQDVVIEVQDDEVIEV